MDKEREEEISEGEGEKRDGTHLMEKRCTRVET